MRIPLFRWVDKVVGSVLCFLLGLARLRRSHPQVKDVLVIKLWAVGESVLTLPMIAALKEKYPNASVTVLCRKRNAAVYGHPLVNHVLLFEGTHLLQLFRKFHSFDLVFDCEPYLNVSALLGWWLGKFMVGFDHGVRRLLYTSRVQYNDNQHVVQTYADMLAPLGLSARPNLLVPLSYTTNDEQRITLLLKEQGISSSDVVIGMCQSVAESGRWRKWPAERYSVLADRLIEKFGVRIVLVGGGDTVENNDVIREACTHKGSVLNLGGKTSLKDLFALMKHFKLFISNDTGPMHIAAAQGVPTIGLFGPNLPTRFAPFGKGNVALYEKQWCSPCINVHRGNFPECFNPDKGACMKLISIESVFDACARILKLHLKGSS
ncbi:glycosyltransferase family 9 protein [Candidatus Woesearchaeota archaeon]|nr:glycosyltransferase family 9 protein [Candidatus Woesearchaeota archaeon]